MKILPLSEAKTHLSSLLDAVCQNAEEVIITRNGKAAGVLVSLDEFEGWRETLAIRSDPEMMSAIKQGLLDIKKKRGKRYTIDDLLDAIA